MADGAAENPRNKTFPSPGAFVLYDRAPNWTGREVRARFAAEFPEHAADWDFPVADEDLDKSLTLVSFKSGISVWAVSLPSPVPGADFRLEIQRSPWWTVAREAVERHRANTLLNAYAGEPWHALSAERRLEGVRAVSRVLAAFGALDSATAVNWIESGVLFPADTAAPFAKSGFPLPFWVRSWVTEERLSGGAPGVSIFTVGLRVFTGRELHFLPVAPEEQERMGGYCDRLMEYLVVNGPVIADGDTIEFEPGQKIKVTHDTAPSGVPLYVVQM